jgi:hypothetical protein
MGVWATATITGTEDQGSGWRQLDRQPTSVAIERGFSGAPVYDATMAVLGILVARIPRSDHVVAWMIPTGRWHTELPEVFPARQISTWVGQPRLTFVQKLTLANALGEVPVMAHVEGRRLVVQNLPGHIRGAVPTHSVANLDLFGLVDAVLEYDDGFSMLYTVIQGLGGREPLAIVHLREIAVEMGLLEATP